MPTKIVGIVAALLISAALIAQQRIDPAKLYEDARRMEAKEDFSGAIKTYQQIVDGSKEPLDVARALTNMGFAYWEESRKDEAQKVCERVLNQFRGLDEALTARAKRCVRLATAQEALLEVSSQYTGDPYSFAISPDGRSILLQGTVEGKRVLLLQQIDTGRKTPIPYSENGRFPFWKPDGRSIAFFANSKLKRLDVEGTNFTNLMELADTPQPFGGAWSSSGFVVFAPYFTGPLYSVRERGGGARVAVTRLQRFPSHRFPQFAPDGRHFLYFAVRVAQTTLMLGSLDDLQGQPLALSAANQAQAATFDSAGHLLYVDNGALYAQNIDSQIKPIGAPARIVDLVAVNAANPGVAAVSVSKTRIAYRADTAVLRQFAWVDRKGHSQGTVGEPDEKIVTASCCFRLSPDDHTVAYRRLVGGGAGSVWTMNVVNGVVSSSFLGRGSSPVWSRTGDAIAFSNVQTPKPPPLRPNLFQKPFNSARGGEWLRNSPELEHPNDWHGNFLLYMRTLATTQDDLLVLPLKGGDPIIPVANSSFRELNGRFSPDGANILYQSDEEGGRFEIYMQAFPGSASARQKISRNGGTNPQWRRKDGREIYFLSSDNHVMVAAVTLAADGRIEKIGEPVELFEAPTGAEFEASSDGERFLINAPVTDAAPPIRILTDWVPAALNAPGSSARTVQTLPTPPPDPADPDGSDPEDTNVPSTAPLVQVTMFDRAGKPLGTVGSAGTTGSVAISPDATQVAFSRNKVISIVDTRSNTTATISASHPVNTSLAFSPDGKRLAYISSDGPGLGLYSRFSNGSGREQQLFRPATNVSNWSMDGLFLTANNTNAPRGLTVRRVETSTSLIVAGGNPLMRISPDSRFLAYVSNEDGSYQVFVQPFDPSAATQASAAVKISPEASLGMIRWRADGQELYFLTTDGRVMAVPITTTPEFKAGTPKALFRVPSGFVLQMGVSGQSADVSADGQRFVFVVPVPANPQR